MQVDPIKPALKVPGTKRLKLIYDRPLSNFAFEFNLRRYDVDGGVSSGALLGEYANLKARSKSHQRRAQGLPLTVEEKFDVFYRATASKEATQRQLEVTFEAWTYTRSR